MSGVSLVLGEASDQGLFAFSLETPDFIQVTGTGDLTKIDIKSGDTGGELDPHGGKLSFLL